MRINETYDWRYLEDFYCPLTPKQFLGRFTENWFQMRTQVLLNLRKPLLQKDHTLRGIITGFSINPFHNERGHVLNKGNVSQARLIASTLVRLPLPSFD